MCKPNMLFQGLDDAQLNTIKDAMAKRYCKDGEDIIKQGATGNCMYLLVSGAVDVYLEGKGDTPVTSYAAGDAFGELALLYNAPRAATCRCRGEVEVWALDQLTFKHIVMDSTIKKRKENQNFFRDIPTFATLTEVEQLTIADALATDRGWCYYCKDGIKTKFRRRRRVNFDAEVKDEDKTEVRRRRRWSAGSLSTAGS